MTTSYSKYYSNTEVRTVADLELDGYSVVEATKGDFIGFQWEQDNRFGKVFGTEDEAWEDAFSDDLAIANELYRD